MLYSFKNPKKTSWYNHCWKNNIENQLVLFIQYLLIGQIKGEFVMGFFDFIFGDRKKDSEPISSGKTTSPSVQIPDKSKNTVQILETSGAGKKDAATSLQTIRQLWENYQYTRIDEARTFAVTITSQMKEKGDIVGLITALKFGRVPLEQEIKEQEKFYRSRDIIGHAEYGTKYRERYCVREAAAKALGELGDSTAVEPLCDALLDPDGAVVSAAIDALAKLNDPRAIQGLVIGQTDPRGQRFDKSRTLLQSLGAPILELFAERLKNENKEVRRLAVSEIGELRDSRSVEILIPILSDENWSVRRQAVFALEKLKDPSVVDRLVVISREDDNKDVRNAAAQAVEIICGKI
jgi:hypothetical protein